MSRQAIGWSSAQARCCYVHLHSMSPPCGLRHSCCRITGKKLTLERTAAGHLDQPPAQSGQGSGLPQGHFWLIFLKISKNQDYIASQSISLGLPMLLTNKLGFALFFNPSHEQVGDTILPSPPLPHPQTKQVHLIYRLNKHVSCSFGGPWLDTYEFVTLSPCTDGHKPGCRNPDTAS